MRLLLTTDTVGGVWSYTATLAALLAADHDLETLLAAFGPEPTPAQRAQIAALPGVALRSYASLLEWQINSAADVALAGDWLVALAAEWQADLLHSNQFAFGSLPTSCPRIVAAHSDLLSWHEWCQPLDGPDPVDDTWRAFVSDYGDLVRRGLAGAHAVVAPSQFMADGLRRHFDFAGEIAVIHNGVAPFYYPKDSTLSAAPLLRVFSAGRFWDSGKNIAMLLEAVGAGINGVTVEIAGAGMPEGGSAHWLGELAHTALLARLPSYDVYVGTSRYEPFGLAPLEAATASCALVLNDIPTFRELWDGAALFVERDSLESLRELLQRLASDPALLRHYKQAAQQKAALYTAEKMADGYAQLYQRVLRMR